MATAKQTTPYDAKKLLVNSRAPAEQGARRRDKIVRNDFEQPQAGPERGESQGWDE
jgi:hypothetical protein